MSNSMPRILFFGRQCLLSWVPLTALLRAKYNIVAVVMPRRSPLLGRTVRRIEPSRLPAVPSPGDLVAAALRHHVPVLEVANLKDDVVREAIEGFAPDLLVISCFPWRLPGALIGSAALGGLNLHPSLLPRHRGPDPIFWFYRSSERITGVTVHRPTGRLDAGAILGQRSLTVEPGLPGDQLEARLAHMGGELLAETITLTLAGGQEEYPQDEAAASYEGWPETSDLRVPREWRALRARSFIRGVIPLGYSPWIDTPDGPLVIAGEPKLVESGSQGNSEVVGGFCVISFNDGALRLRLAST